MFPPVSFGSFDKIKFKIISISAKSDNSHLMMPRPSIRDAPDMSQNLNSRPYPPRFGKRQFGGLPPYLPRLGRSSTTDED